MHQIEQVRPIYEAAGILEATTDAFFQRTEQALRAGFARAGVAVDELDDLSRILTRAPARE
jgi:hypothetical protein